MNINQMTTNSHYMYHIASMGLDISYKGLIYLRCLDSEAWEVEYESYFNPHANPKQLFDKAIFTTCSDAVNFFISKLKEILQDD